MAYFRGRYYLWASEDEMHFWVPPVGDESGQAAVPHNVCDAFVAMRWTEMTKAEREAAIRYAVEHAAGNFGAEKLLRRLGIPTAMDWVKEMARKRQAYIIKDAARYAKASVTGPKRSGMLAQTKRRRKSHRLTNTR